MKVWFFMHRVKPERSLILVSSDQLQKNDLGYMDFPSWAMSSFIIRPESSIYDYIYERMDILEPTGKTSVWEADL